MTRGCETAPGDREPELTAVLQAVGQTPAAGLTVVVVSGEAGIGKSWLLAEATKRLAASHSPVLFTAADDLQRRIPYAALTAAVRSLETGAGAPHAQLRQETLAALDVHADPAIPDQHWFGRVCHATAKLLTALCERQPAVLAIDDLDQLDNDSLALLTVVMRRLANAPLGLLATLRTPRPERNPAAEQLVERLERQAEIVRVELGPLSADGVAAIVASVLEAPVDTGLAREVHRRSDGNPFFATEIARSLRELELVAIEGHSARLVPAADSVTLTRRDAVLRRVAPLIGYVRVVARSVAVLRQVRLDQMGLVARVARLPEAVVVTAFDELLCAGVVTRDEQRGFCFTHDLVAAALYDEIGPAERRGLHEMVANRLLEDRARGLAVDVMELAWHIAESAQPGDELAAAVLAEAAELARHSAPDRAAALCRRALELLPEKSAERASLLALVCRALYRASRPEAAIDPGLAALRLLPTGADRSRTATTVIGSLFTLGRFGEALAVAEDGIARDSSATALHAQRALLLGYMGRYEDALAAAEVVESLEALLKASPAEQVIVYNQLAMLASILYRHDKTVEYANRALRASRGAPTLELQALALGAAATSLTGLIHDATWRVRRAEALLDDEGGRAFVAEILVSKIALDWFGGRWNAVLERLPAATAEIESGHGVMLLDALRSIELDIRAWRGEFDIAGQLADRPLPTSPHMRGLHCLALIDYHLARGEVEAVARTIDTTVADIRTAAYGCVQLGRLIDVQVEQGHTDDATGTLRTLSEIASHRFLPLSRAVLRRATGLVHRDPDQLRLAVREAGTGGLEFEKARSQLALGSLDPEETASLTEAYVTFQRLGAHGLRRHTGRRLKELGAKVPRPRARKAGLLTEAEERVARLVQQGMRNRDIAAALFYSPRTIEVYLSRIYAKLHVSSRLELARALDSMSHP